MNGNYEEDLIAQDVESARKVPIVENIGMFTIKPANKFIKEAKERPDPTPLFKELWYEGEACCLFADTNLGKSILAVQIADHIARVGKRVIYFDFELSDKQFQKRYTANEGHSHVFPETFARAEVNSEGNCSISNDELLKQIADISAQYYADVVIIDNLTWVCMDSEKGSEAGRFMQSLIQIKKDKKFSMLVISHTPKRDAWKPLTKNDIAGSNRLACFFDSAFAIGRSARDENLRYIKQIKCRQEEFTYGEGNVIVCAIEKESDGFLCLKIQGYTTEREHLRIPNDEERDSLKERVAELVAGGKSYREVSQILGISRTTVGNYLKK